MRFLATFFSIAIAAVSLIGCGQIGGSNSSTSHGGMAVVDLDRVALETGRRRVLDKSIEAEAVSLKQQLQQVGVNAQAQFDEKKKSFSSEMTDAEQKELAQWTLDANGKISQIQNQAQLSFERFKQTQLAQFRAEIKPIAQEVASKRGLSIVIPKNEGLLLSVDPGVDITDEVIKVVRAANPTSTSNEVAEKPQTEQQKQNADADTAAKPSAAKRATSPAKPAGTARAVKQNDDSESFR